MKYITAIFYSVKENKTRRDKVVYYSQDANNCIEAAKATKLAEEHIAKSIPNAENVHGRTFEDSVPSFDLR
jgi:hypothetical protein